MTGFLGHGVIESSGDYQIQRSLRLRASATAYLVRTFGAGGNRRTWTWSGWVKRGQLGPIQNIFTEYSGAVDTGTFALGFDSSNRLTVDAYTFNFLVTSSVYRDPSAHLHVVLAFDTTNATANNRVRLFVNGVEVTAFGVRNNPTLDGLYGVNEPVAHYLSRSAIAGTNYVDGYLTEVNFIDGQALTPSSFGQIDPVTGQWTAKKYSGTYGTNGFYLDFSDPTSPTTLGYDASGNANHWTPNNISTTAGATYDSMLDVPLGGGGTERGNYCTFNPLVNNAISVQAGVFDNANSRYRCAASNNAASFTQGTISVASGKWYVEMLVETLHGSVSGWGDIGWHSTATSSALPSTNIFVLGNTTIAGRTYKNSGVNQGSLTTIATSDVIGAALDLDNLTCQFYLNGVAYGSQITGLTPGSYSPTAALYASSAGDFARLVANFGQRPFAYTPPAGFKALHTGNLINTTVAVSGSFTGNLSTDGPFIWCNGTPETLTINGNAVTFGTHADRTAGGFKLRTSSASYNASGPNTWTATVLSPSTKSAFKYQLAKGN
jgi:hypothetical protein